jgi:hypothetical protein
MEGVRVKEIPKFLQQDGEDSLKLNDIILSVDKFAIADDGTIKLLHTGLFCVDVCDFQPRQLAPDN